MFKFYFRHDVLFCGCSLHVHSLYLNETNLTFQKEKNRIIMDKDGMDINVIFVCKRPSKRTRDFGRSDNFFSSSYMYLPIVMAASGVDRPSKYHNRHEVTNEAKNTDGR